MRGLGLLPFATAACFALAAATLTSFPIIAPEVTSELHLSYSEVGGITAAYLFSYGLFQIPSALLGLQFGSGRILLAAVAVMSCSALVGTFATSYAGWIVSRALLGVGGAVVFPLSLHLLTQAFSGRRLVTGIGIFVSGWGLGITLALFGAARILRAFGWREVLFAAVALGVVVFILLWRSLGALGRAQDERVLATTGLWKLLPSLAGNRRLNLLALINGAGTATLIAVPGWLPLYLTRRFDASAADASAALASIGLGVVVGGWSGSIMANWLGWRPVVIASLVVSAALTAVIPLLDVVGSVVVVATLIAWIGTFFPAPVQSRFPSVVPTAWTALAAAYYNTLGWAGAFGAVLLFGYLVDWTGSFTTAWLWLALVPWLGVAAGVIFPEEVRKAGDLVRPGDSSSGHRSL